MLALVLLALVPIMMWLSQSILLARAGLPVSVRIGAVELPGRLRHVHRAATNAAFAVVLIAYPLVRGRSPIRYYSEFFPLGGRPWEMLYGLGAAVLYLGLLYLAWVASGNVRFRLRHSGKKIARRLAGVPVTAVLVAFIEELLFRGMLLAGLLESWSPIIALTIGVLVFAGAHYIRSVKRYWTFPGHLGLGLVLCVAFLCTRSLWLSMGVHAGGVLMLMGVRPFIRYTGHAWLIGASIFPYAGVAGIAGLVLLTLNVWLTFGGI